MKMFITLLGLLVALAPLPAGATGGLAPITDPTSGFMQSVAPTPTSTNPAEQQRTIHA
jgi:hypothetical protein